MTTSIHLTLATLAAGLGLALPARAIDEAGAMAWSKKNNCAACHALDKKMVGPSLQDIGKKYAGDGAALAALTTKVRQGGKGVWGQVPMPPNPAVKEPEVKEFVQFVLTLK